MQNRIQYIDALKGIAILCVIIGHSIAYQFYNYHEVLDNEARELMLLWRIIYSFHMPLFAFCSGLLMAKGKEFYTAKNIANTLYKRAKSLLLPFGVVSGIWFFVNGYWGDHYWFLIVIWECIVAQILISWLCAYIPKVNEHVEALLLSLVAVASLYVYPYFSKYDVFPIIDFSRFHHLFPYYVVGILVTRYRMIERLMAKNWFYSIALILFVVFTYLLTFKGYVLPFGKLTNRIIPLSAICILVYICTRDDFSNTKINRALSNIGKHSLELYILHFFFLIPLYFVGECSMQIYETEGYMNGFAVLLIQLLSAFAVTIVVLSLSYLFMWIIGKNNILSQLFLGRKYS